MPSMMPAMMASHGKPGIAGSTIGVETELVTEVLVVVGVLTTVIVDIEVLTSVVVSELVVDKIRGELVDEVVAVTGVDAVEVLELLETTVMVLVAGVAVDVDVVPCPTTGGFKGSKWNIPARGFVAPATPAPTAQPSCGFVRETERNARPGELEPATRAGEVGTTVHEAPS